MSVRLSSSTSATAAPAVESTEGQQAADPLAARQTKRETPAQMQARLKKARSERDEKSAKEADATAKTFDGAADAADKTGDTLNGLLAKQEGKADANAAITDAQVPAETPAVDVGAPSDVATSAIAASGDVGAVDAPLADATPTAEGGSSAGGTAAAISGAITAAKVVCKGISTAEKMKAASDRGADGSAVAMTAVGSGVGVVGDVTQVSADKDKATATYNAAYKGKVDEYNGATEQANELAGKVRDLDSQRATLVAQGGDTSDVDAELEQATAQHEKTSANRDHMVETAGKMAARSGHVTG